MQNIEEWENEMTENDFSSFIWEKSKSKENCDNLKIETNEKLADYKTNITKLFDEGESTSNLNAYKNSVLNILNLNNNKSM